MEWPQVIDYRKYIPIGYVLIVVAVCALLIYWSLRGITYEVTRRHVRIKYLGIPFRWIRLTDITSITRRPVWWAEKWHNTWRIGNRRLVLHRKRGLIRAITITPESPFVFREELIQARNALLPPAPAGVEDTATGDDTIVLRKS